MPTKNYLDSHRQLKIWVSHDMYAQLKTACRDRTLADVLRQAIATIISKEKGS